MSPTQRLIQNTILRGLLSKPALTVQPPGQHPHGQQRVFFQSWLGMHGNPRVSLDLPQNIVHAPLEKVAALALRQSHNGKQFT